MLDCPDLAALEDKPTSAVSGHVAGCASCRLVAELLDERRRGIAERDREAECARFEMLIAARDDGTIGLSAAEILDAHLRECMSCSAVAATLPPASERSELSSLPAVSTASYALGREVARGGMGRILEALDVRIGRPVAVKELLGKAPSLAARFEREARVTARLQHPGIVPIYEIGKWPDGTPFYAMRMVEGRTLRDAIRDKPTLDARLELLPAVIAAADAVAFAHAKRIIHRDLTPANILVGAYGDTVVIDWGLAKDLSDPSDDLAVGPYRDEPTTAAGLTSAGAVIGTAAYMPPEQANGDPVDERADVYALGAILYHVLAGAPPYRSTASDEVVRQVQAGPPEAIADVAPGAPRDLASLVTKAMSRAVTDRYPSARELADELRRFQTGRLVEAHHYSRRERTRRWVRQHRAGVLASLASIVALATAGSIGFAGVTNARDHAESERSVAVEQRAVADAAKTKAQRENASLMEEQGRQELLAGNTTRALAWLDEAYKAGDTSEPLRFMLGTAMRQLEAVERTFECGGAVSSVEFSPDGTRLMAACEYGIKIWSVTDGKLLTEISTATDGATYSHDGRRIASKKWATINLFDAVSGAQIFSKREHTQFVRTMSFTPDDQLVVTAGDDAKVRTWDANGAVLHVMDAGSGKMNVVRHELTPDGRTIVTTTGDGRVVEWDVATGARRLTFMLPAQPVAGMTGGISPDGARFVACGVDGNVSVWELATGRMVFDFVAHAYGSFGCAFSPDGSKVMSTGIDGFAKVWDVRHRRLVATLNHGGIMFRGKFSPDGRAATLGAEGQMKIWHAATGSLIASLDQPSSLADVLEFSPDGSRLVTGRAPNTIVMSRAPNVVVPRVLAVGASLSSASPTAKQLAIKAADGAVSIVDANLVPLRHESVREPVAWSRDGARIVAAGAAGGAVVIDLQTGATIARLAMAAKPEHFELDENGRRLLVVGASVEVWDVEHQRVELALADRQHASALTPSGDLVVAWSDPQKIEVWDVARHRVQARLSLASPVMDVVGFDADARHLILAERDTESPIPTLPFIARLAIYETATGERVFSQPGRLFPVIDPSHRRIVSAGLNQKLEMRSTDGALLSAFTPGPSFLLAGIATPDGALIVVDDGAGLTVRSADDGRLLASIRTMLRNVTYTQDSLNFASDNFDLATDGRSVVVQGTEPVIWQLPRESRPPAEIDRLVRDRVAWRVADGQLRVVETKIRGRVLRHGQPVAGADVATHEGMSWRRVASGSDGRFEISELPRGQHLLIAMSPDHDAHGSQLVTTAENDGVQDIELDADASIAGQVLDNLGQPVPNAPIHAVQPNGIAAYPDVKTDAGGRFTIRALAPTKFMVFVAGGNGFVNEPAGGNLVDVATDHHVTGVQLVVHRETGR